MCRLWELGRVLRIVSRNLIIMEKRGTRRHSSGTERFGTLRNAIARMRSLHPKHGLLDAWFRCQMGDEPPVNRRGGVDLTWFVSFADVRALRTLLLCVSRRAASVFSPGIGCQPCIMRACLFVQPVTRAYVGVSQPRYGRDRCLSTRFGV